MQLFQESMDESDRVKVQMIKEASRFIDESEMSSNEMRKAYQLAVGMEMSEVRGGGYNAPRSLQVG